MKYEIFVLLPNLEENEIKIADKEIRGMIEKCSGSVVDFYEFGKRKLSYVINKIRQGFYLDYAVEIDSENLKKLERELKLNNTILRFDIGRLEGELNKVMQEEENSNELRVMSNEGKKIEKEDVEDVKEEVVPDEKVEDEKEKKSEKKKVDMDELDEKLDELIK